MFRQLFEEIESEDYMNLSEIMFQQMSEELQLATIKDHEQECARIYMNLPEIPYGQTVTIKSIGASNYHPLTKEALGTLTYESFRLQWPHLFELATDPELDYTDEEQVSPAIVNVIFSENAGKAVMCRVNYKLWFPLNDCYTAHMIEQVQTGIKKLPLYNIFIDYNNKWVGELFRQCSEKAIKRAVSS